MPMPVCIKPKAQGGVQQQPRSFARREVAGREVGVRSSAETLKLIGSPTPLKRKDECSACEPGCGTIRVHQATPTGYLSESVVAAFVEHRLGQAQPGVRVIAARAIGEGVDER